MEIDADLREAYSFHAKFKKPCVRVQKGKLEKAKVAAPLKPSIEKKAQNEAKPTAPQLTYYRLSVANEVLLETCLEKQLVDKLKLANIPTMNVLFNKSKKDLYNDGNLTQQDVGIIYNAKEDLFKSIKGDSEALKEGWLEKVATCVEEKNDWPLCIRSLYLIPVDMCFVSPSFFQDYIDMAERKRVLTRPPENS